MSLETGKFTRLQITGIPTIMMHIEKNYLSEIILDALEEETVTTAASNQFKVNFFWQSIQNTNMTEQKHVLQNITALSWHPRKDY